MREINIEITDFVSIETGKPYVDLGFALFVDGEFRGHYKTIVNIFEELKFPSACLYKIKNCKQEVIHYFKQWRIETVRMSDGEHRYIVGVDDIVEDGVHAIVNKSIRYKATLFAPCGRTSHTKSTSCVVDINEKAFIKYECSEFYNVSAYLNCNKKSLPQYFENKKIGHMIPCTKELFLRSLPEIKRLSFYDNENLFLLEPEIVKAIIERLSHQKARTINYMTMFEYFTKHGLPVPQIGKSTKKEIEIYL